MDDRLAAFINGLLPAESSAEKHIRECAEANNVPVIRRDTAAFIRLLLNILKPKRILEIGTATGYSASVMAFVLPEAHIDTVEIDIDSAVEARKNMSMLGFEGRVRVIAGDGAEVMSSLRQPYDMIFLDAAKGQYINIYDDAIRLLNAGGLLLCDNCIFYDKILLEPENAPHKHRTIVANMRGFLKRMMSDSRLVPALINVGDGMAAAYKKENAATAAATASEDENASTAAAAASENENAATAAAARRNGGGLI